MPIKTRYLKTNLGKLKMTSAGVGFLVVVFASVIYDKQRIACSVPTVRCDWVRVGFFRCLQPWLAKLGLALIIMSWLFSMAMLFGSLMLDCSREPQFLTIDFVGHVTFGVAQIFSFLFILLYLLNVMTLFGRCFDDGRGHDKDGHPLTAGGCVSIFLLESDGIYWVLVAIFALVHAIFLLILSGMLMKERRTKSGRRTHSQRRMSSETIQSRESRYDDDEEYRRERKHKHKHKHRERDRDRDRDEEEY